MELPVVIQKTVYRKDDFAIVRVSLNALSPKYTPELENVLDTNLGRRDSDDFTATLNSLSSSEKIDLKHCVVIGEFVNHKVYGPQFKAEFYYLELIKTRESFMSFLQTLPNIKEIRSKAIIDRFGIEGTIDVLDNNPERLTEINGITLPRVQPIKERWEAEKARRELYMWLSDHGISPTIGKNIYEAWGKDSQKIIMDNPYRLTEIKSIGFLKADLVAHKVLKEISLDNRMKACLQYLLEEDMRSNGNLCRDISWIQKEAADLLIKCDDSMGVKSNREAYIKIISKVIKANLQLFTAIRRLEGNQTPYVYLKKTWDKENYIAKELFRRSMVKNEAMRQIVEQIEFD